MEDSPEAFGLGFRILMVASVLGFWKMVLFRIWLCGFPVHLRHKPDLDVSSPEPGFSWFGSLFPMVSWPSRLVLVFPNWISCYVIALFCHNSVLDLFFL